MAEIRLSSESILQIVPLPSFVRREQVITCHVTRAKKVVWRAKLKEMKTDTFLLGWTQINKEEEVLPHSLGLSEQVCFEYLHQNCRVLEKCSDAFSCWVELNPMLWRQQEQLLHPSCGLYIVDLFYFTRKCWFPGTDTSVIKRSYLCSSKAVISSLWYSKTLSFCKSKSHRNFASPLLSITFSAVCQCKALVTSVWQNRYRFRQNA